MNPLPKPTAEDFRAMNELAEIINHWQDRSYILGGCVSDWWVMHSESFRIVKDACKELVDDVCHPDKDTLRYNYETFSAMQHKDIADLKQAMTDDKNTLRKIIRGK